MAKTEMLTACGPTFTVLANTVSDAINHALKQGMEIDEAACCVVTVAADYARLEYGDIYLKALADIVRAQAGRPAPENNPD